ncbi:MAG: hypothetical protein K2P50_06430 [Lachnospiraceae bacterium]|nr:hypothetical protein [Lachnospiraceae bacterium]
MAGMIQAFSNRHSIRKYGDDGGKRIFCFAVCVLLLISAAAVFLILRVRGSMVVHAGEDIIPAGEIAFFRQDDEKWAAEKLGDSRYTMESSGCLVCCITSTLVMGGKTEETPFTVNERFSKQGVYDLQGNILWDNLRRYGGCEVEVFNKADEELLLDCLREGKYPIVRVRVKGVGNFHYVLITGAREGNFYCMDPLKDGERPLAEYGNRIYAARLVS